MTDIRPFRAYFLPPWSLPTRLLLTLTAALLPLGIAAILLTTNAYHALQDERRRQSVKQAAIVAGRIDAILHENLQLLGFVWTALGDIRTAPAQCQSTAGALTAYSPLLRDISIISADGSIICGAIDSARARQALAKVKESPNRARFMSVLYSDQAGELRLALAPASRLRGNIEMLVLARIDADVLGGPLAQDGQTHAAYQLVVDGRTIAETPGSSEKRRENPLHNDWHAVGGSGLRLYYSIPQPELPHGRLLSISLPVLMWLAALMTGWLVIRHVAARPLLLIRQRVEHLASTASATETLPAASRDNRDLGSREMQQLADAFDTMAARIKAHEQAQAEALETQARLVREVHHRVKNNLQVISSLLSLYARAATAPEAAEAYAAIRLRINALTTVHRWLFEDSDNGKVPLRPLMHDLCQSIAHAIHDRYDTDFSISQDVAPLHVAQDHAVSLAFLVTEIAASAVENQPPAPVAIALRITRSDGQGRLVVATERFRGDCALAPGQMTATARIANGMARQLRTQLLHDSELGEYRLVFTLI